MPVVCYSFFLFFCKKKPGRSASPFLLDFQTCSIFLSRNTGGSCWWKRALQRMSLAATDIYAVPNLFLLGPFVEIFQVLLKKKKIFISFFLLISFSLILNNLTCIEMTLFCVTSIEKTTTLPPWLCPFGKRER